jgi:hypothetical protein
VTKTKVKAKAKPKAKAKRTAGPKPKPKRAAKRAKRPAKKRDVVVCEHGETPPTFVCRHVAEGVACGFHAGDPTPKNPWPDAWCDSCDEAFQAAGGKWTKQSESGLEIKLLCTYCYDEARERNATIPPLARGAAVTLSNREAGKLFHHAVHHAQDLQERSDKRWHWQEMAHWNFEPDERRITFRDPSRATLVADIRTVGSYSTRTKTFQWAWQTYEVGSAEARDSLMLRTFGEVRGVRTLTTANWECDEAEGWEMTALAAYLLDADAVYRVPQDHLFWFVLLSNWRAPN